jgi:hypothetical protein
MNPQVYFQMPSVMGLEVAVWMRTNVGFIDQMSLQMLSQIGLAFGCEFTLWTFERFFLAMNVHVTFQI